jgi:hypothetical protein
MEIAITQKLSSQSGDRTQQSNREVAEKCCHNPHLLAEISGKLDSDDQRLVADCAEVLTLVTEKDPMLTLPFLPQILPLIHHRYAKARWESIHTISLVADRIPDIITTILPDLSSIIQDDKSTIARDYSVATLAAYASTGAGAAENAYPYLLEAIEVWGDKHAARVMEGLTNVNKHKTAYKNEILYIAEGFTESRRVTVRKAARKLYKEIQR